MVIKLSYGNVKYWLLARNPAYYSVIVEAVMTRFRAHDTHHFL